MPWVLICPAGDGLAFLFDLTGPDGVSLDLESEYIKSIAYKFLDRHKCSRDKLDHSVLPVVDPYEMRGV